MLPSDRKPGEWAGPMTAIRRYCLQCAGGSSNTVRECTWPGCWLYPFRFGSVRQSHTIVEKEQSDAQCE